MDERTLRRAYRNAWILTALSVVFLALFAWFVFHTNRNAPAPGWDMGGRPFVPASDPGASGYHLPVKRAAPSDEEGR